MGGVVGGSQAPNGGGCGRGSGKWSSPVATRLNKVFPVNCTVSVSTTHRVVGKVSVKDRRES
eukprot:139421-Prorocentrum_minimum.AAC.1